MPAIRLRTAIPGPLSKELALRREQAVSRGVSQLTPLFVSRTEGAVVEDVDGNRFLDLAAGDRCQNAGIARRPCGSVSRAGGSLLHTCFMVTPYESYVRAGGAA